MKMLARLYEWNKDQLCTTLKRVFQTKAEAMSALQINNDILLHHTTLVRKQDIV